MATWSAPGKVFLFGEHAVVFGKSGLAMAIKPRVYVTVRKARNPAKVNSPYIEGCFEELGVTGSVYIHSQLPSSSGLGSSAAVTVATLCAINTDDGFRMFGRMLATTPNARYLLGNIDIVVGIRAFTDARRRVVEISEVVPLEDGSCRLAPIFVWTRNGMGNQALGDGQFRASGNIPRFYRELERGGMALDSSIFNS